MKISLVLVFCQISLANLARILRFGEFSQLIDYEADRNDLVGCISGASIRRCSLKCLREPNCLTVSHHKLSCALYPTSALNSNTSSATSHGPKFYSLAVKANLDCFQNYKSLLQHENERHSKCELGDKLELRTGIWSEWGSWHFLKEPTCVSSQSTLGRYRNRTCIPADDVCLGESEHNQVRDVWFGKKRTSNNYFDIKKKCANSGMHFFDDLFLLCNTSMQQHFDDRLGGTKIWIGYTFERTPDSIEAYSNALEQTIESRETINWRSGYPTRRGDHAWRCLQYQPTSATLQNGRCFTHKINSFVVCSFWVDK